MHNEKKHYADFVSREVADIFFGKIGQARRTVPGSAKLLKALPSSVYPDGMYHVEWLEFPSNVKIKS